METFKQALIQAFPKMYDKIYTKQDSFPEDVVQKIPEGDELEEVNSFFKALEGKTVSIEALIDD